MAGGMDELIDLLYGMVEEAWSIPLGKDKCVVEREKVLDILDELRGNMPSEIKDARAVVERRTDLLAAAKKEADAIRKQAEDRARQLVNESEIVSQAKQKANEILSTAESKSKELRRVANAYCDDVLKRTEEAVGSALGEVRQMRGQFKQTISSGRQ